MNQGPNFWYQFGQNSAAIPNCKGTSKILNIYSVSQKKSPPAVFWHFSQMDRNFSINFYTPITRWTR